MVPSHRRALRARLLSFRHIDGIYLEILARPRLASPEDKAMAGGTPANPAALGGATIFYARDANHALCREP
jgi:hypothetical protein